MAIEFNCPYCTSTIRVKDDAAGKRGRCPRCEEQLIVPSVAPPTAASPRVGTPAAPAQPTAAPIEPAPVTTPNTAAMPPQLDAPATESHPSTSVSPATDFPAVSAPPAPSYARPRKRRRNNNKLALGILTVCAVVVVALGASLWWQEQPPQLEGDFTGEFVGASTLQPMVVPKSGMGAAPDVQARVLKSLRQLPYTVKSPLVVTEFRGSEEGLEVRLIPTTNTVVVRVNPTTSAALSEWLEVNGSRIREKRNSDLKQAVDRFFDAYGQSGEPDTNDATYYRNNLGLAALTTGFGYIVEAIAGRQVCPCVHEDSVGNLYFAVPAETTGFAIAGRTLDTGRKMFPGRYNVNCEAIPERVEVVDPSEAKAAPPENPTGEPGDQTSPDNGGGQSMQNNKSNSADEKSTEPDAAMDGKGTMSGDTMKMDPGDQ